MDIAHQTAQLGMESSLRSSLKIGAGGAAVAFFGSDLATWRLVVTHFPGFRCRNEL